MDKIDEKIVNLKREKKELDNMDINQGVLSMMKGLPSQDRWYIKTK